MSEYWKSTPKHYCEICKVWLSGHPRNVEAHNQSEAHKVKQDRLLQQMEINRRQKERENVETLSTVRAIEAQATAAMRHQGGAGSAPPDPKLSLNYALNRAARFAPRLPPKSLLDDVVRPLEEDRIRKFIAKATGIDTANVASFIAPEDDFRKTMLFFSDESMVPAAIKKDPKYSNKKNWEETEDEATTLPLYVNKQLNISIWEKPSILLDNIETIVTSAPTGSSNLLAGFTQSDGKETHEPELSGVVEAEESENEEAVRVSKRQKTESGIRKGLEAPVLGPWVPVQANESVFGDNVNKELALEAGHSHGKSAEERLTEFFETAGNRPDRTLQMKDALDEADMILVEPSHLKTTEISGRNVATSDETEKPRPQFKKRVRKKT